MTGMDYIIIIGGVGYEDQASRHQTNVYMLDLSDFLMRRIETSGVAPGGGRLFDSAELLIWNYQLVIRLISTIDPNGQSSNSSDSSDGEQPMNPGVMQIAQPLLRESFMLRLRDMTWI